MSQTALRLLELARSQLGGVDARFEIGGKDPEDPRLVWLNLEQDQRVVVVFAEPPSNSALLLSRLETLMQSFAETLASLGSASSSLGEPPAHRRLESYLDALRARSGANLAIIVDQQSPMIWSESGLGQGFDQPALAELLATADECQGVGADLNQLVGLTGDALDSAILAALTQAGVTGRQRGRLLAARIERAQQVVDGERLERALRAARLIAVLERQAGHSQRGGAVPERFREEFDERIHLGRRITGIYWLLLTFPLSWSELHAEGTLRDMLPGLERLVLALPRFDPPTGGGRVLRLPSPLRSV